MIQIVQRGGKAKVSKAEGNGLIKKDDGLYVSNTGVNISEAEGNILETKEDGLYATASGYELPPATDESIGGVKPGSSTTVTDDGTIEVDPDSLTEKVDINFESIKEDFNKDVNDDLEDIDFEEMING